MKQLHSKQDFDETLRLPFAIIFKHSTRCPVSARAEKELNSFLEANPDYPLFMVNVIEQRELSAYISSSLSVQHESPQVFLLSQGNVNWSASHYEITQRSVGEAEKSRI